MSQDATADRWNVGRLLNWTADFLRRKGSESPRLEAEVLLASVLGWERVQLYTRFEVDVDEPARARFRDLVRRRAEGVPVAYLTAHKEFYSLKFAVSPAVLIPRADTEHLVVEALGMLKGVPGARFVDVGTGSGCVALAILSGNKTAKGVAIDLDESALNVARGNGQALGLAGRIDFRRGNLLDPVADEAPFDAIVSNPPYIRSAVVSILDPGVRDHEPHLALDGGEDGLRVVAPLIEAAVPRLKVGGHLLLEIGSDQEAEVRALLEAQPGLDLAPTVRDHAHHPRVLRATRRS